MTENLVDITLTVRNRPTISFACSLDDPVLHQICHGYARRNDADDQLLFLELAGDTSETIYFTRSTMEKLECSQPLPDHLFEKPTGPTVDDYLHLDIERRWIEWGLRNRTRGVDPDQIFQAMHDGGAPYYDIITLLDHEPAEFPGVRNISGKEDVRPYAETGLDPRFRFDSEFIELYEIPDFLTVPQCRAFEDLLDNRPEQPGIVQEHLADSSRSGDSHVYNHSENIPELVSEYQERISSLLQTDIRNLEPLRCQVYGKSRQYRAHVDYLHDLEAEESVYQSRDGQQRLGQRQWTVVVYLRDGEKGSGTWFSRLKREFAPAQGTALVWRNLYPSGNPNPYTIHAAMPAGANLKLALTQWVRNNSFR